MTISDAAVRAGLDALPGQAAILDRTGRIRFTNRAWREFGAANGGDPDHVGANYLAVCEESDDEKARRVGGALRELVDGERESVSVEYPCHAPDRDRWFIMRAEAFEHDGERYLLVVHFDITDRKLAELRVREQNDRLESVANVLSHDIRNPLTVAMGHAEMIESEHADRLLRSLERIDAIVEDALLLATRDDVADTRPVDLVECAERAWAQVETRDAALERGESVRFEADPDLLAHVFENLFRNAVEHGAGTVRVGPLDDGFYVEDDGPGIPAAERENVFDASYSTAEDGTGLGLVIVERVVEAHGWSVRATESSRIGETGGPSGSRPAKSDGGGAASDPGPGARFEVTF